MTLKIKIEVPADGGPYEALVAESGGNRPRMLAPGDSAEFYVHSGNSLTVTELPAGTKALADFPLGKACDLSGEGDCEACQ